MRFKVAFSSLFLILTAALLVLPVVFLWLHLAAPFDGGRLMPDADAVTEQGLRVTPPQPVPGGLQAGDIVVAVAGRPVEEWTEDLFTRDAFRSPWQPDTTFSYTVLRDGREVEVVPSAGPYPLGAILRTNWGVIVFSVIFLLVAGFVLLRRPQLLAARLLLLSAAASFSASSWSLGLQVSDFLNGWGFWLYQITAVFSYMLYWIAGLHFTLVFPQSLPVIAPRRRIYLLYGLPYLLILLYMIFTRPRSANTLAWIASWDVATLIHAAVLLLLTLLTAAWQYHASRQGTGRQQAKWVILAGLVTGGLALVFYFLPPLVGAQPADTNMIGVIVAVFPLALAAAILRYRLFDIDVLIRRTLVYTVLSALLALLYFASVVMLQTLFSDLFDAGSSIAVVISTLLIAALFTPLRHRVQQAIDRRFYRRRYDAQQVLAAFATAARNETDPDRLASELLRVVQETVQPAHVTFWQLD